MTSPPVLLDTAALRARWGISRERLWQLVRDGKIPSGQLLGTSRVWTLEEIVDYEQTPAGLARLARRKDDEA